jgi:hypothetical protein
MRAGMMLALIMAFLLIWYTYVVPAGPIGSRRPVRDREMRGLTPGVRDDAQTVEDLDWPEYIYP